MKNLGFAIILLLGLTGSAQSVLNNYKYVIVPTQFDGFRSENQFQTSTLVKFYLVQKGLNVFYDNVAPAELNKDRCIALYATLDDQSTTFNTKVAVVFKDCEGKEQYRTQMGMSKVKQYAEAYRESLGEAFASLKDYRFEYKEAAEPAPVVLNLGNDVKNLPPAPEKPPVMEKEEKDSEIVIDASQDKETVALLPMPEEKTEAVTLADAVTQDGEEKAVFPSSLYAQKTETGYQLVDTAPSIQFYLKETSLPDVYLAERKGQNGILYLKNDKWIFEYYQGSDRMQEELQIKF